MSFTRLMDSWRAEREPSLTREEYAIRLPVDDAARLHALDKMFPGVSVERLVTDLIGAALDEVEASMPYVPGDKVIREDDHGDPVYEDVGPTSEFMRLTQAERKRLESGGN